MLLWGDHALSSIDPRLLSVRLCCTEASLRQNRNGNQEKQIKLIQNNLFQISTFLAERLCDLVVKSFNPLTNPRSHLGAGWTLQSNTVVPVKFFGSCSGFQSHNTNYGYSVISSLDPLLVRRTDLWSKVVRGKLNTDLMWWRLGYCQRSWWSN